MTLAACPPHREYKYCLLSTDLILKSVFLFREEKVLSFTNWICLEIFIPLYL